MIIFWKKIIIIVILYKSYDQKIIASMKNLQNKQYYLKFFKYMVFVLINFNNF